MSPRPSSCSVAWAGTRKRSCQTTSLASSRRACSASFSPAAVAFFESSSFVATNVSSSPCMPPTRSWSASTAWSVDGRSGPGTSRPRRVVDVLLLLLDQPLQSCVSSSACLSPGVVRSSARSVPILAEFDPIVAELASSRRSSRRASCRWSSPAPRRRAARRPGSRTRRARSAAGSASGRAEPETAAAAAPPPPPPPPRGGRARVALAGAGDSRVASSSKKSKSRMSSSCELTQLLPSGDGPSLRHVSARKGGPPAAAKWR